MVNKLANAVTKVGDQFAGNVFGGTLVKAKLKSYKEFKAGALSGPLLEMEFFINPEKIKTSQEVILKGDQGAQRTEEKKYDGSLPQCLTLDGLVFDTYDTRKSVRSEYIDKLEKLVKYHPQTHHIPVVHFVWGQFSQDTETSPENVFYVSKLDVEYTMFLPDATPVRATVTLGMEQKLPPDAEEQNRPKNSPDHAKLYTVKRGDTLQAIANAEYDDPREWRRIAKTNNIDDPMTLRPGMKLLVPPILK